MRYNSIQESTKSKAEKSPRQNRHLDFISQFTADIQHISSDINVVADTLSRIGEANSITDITKSTFQEYQKSDKQLEILLKSSDQNNSSKFQLRKIKTADTELFYETSPGKNRLYVPELLRKATFDNIHKLSHPGIRASRKLVSERFFWPSNFELMKLLH